MAILGQESPASDTDVTLFTASGSAYQTSTLWVCNRNAAQVKFRVAVVKSGESAAAALNDKRAIFFDMPLDANDAHEWTCGLHLEDGDKVVVRSNTANTNFHLYGIAETA